MFVLTLPRDHPPTEKHKSTVNTATSTFNTCTDRRVRMPIENFAFAKRKRGATPTTRSKPHREVAGGTRPKQEGLCVVEPFSQL